MSEPEELFRLFSRFPTQKHVIEICKMGQGKETCRYLATGSRWECLKTSCLLKKNIDKKVENGEMIAKGDNCQGLLGLVIRNQRELKGKKVSYIRPYCNITSGLKKIEVRDGILTITMFWQNGRKLDIALDINDLDIIVNREGINFFQNLNLGDNFTKRIVIFFS